MTSPPPTSLGGLVRHLGPGFIITATIVGSGELIVTPKLGASVGFSLLWFIVLGCVLKVFVQIQLARTAVATGRTTLDALNALPGPRWRVSWILWLWLAMYLSLIFQVSGIVGGIAGVFAELGIGGGPRAWALPVGVSCALLLASGRYSVVERGSTWMVAAFTCRPSSRSASCSPRPTASRRRNCGAACSSRCPTASPSPLPRSASSASARRS